MKKQKDLYGQMLIGGLFFGIIIGISMMFTLNLSRPTAMDVYKGKTVLQYKIIDGIKTDSIVVFKLK